MMVYFLFLNPETYICYIIILAAVDLIGNW
jgi:hypothetical protein